MGIEGTYLNRIKDVYNKTTANIIVNGKKLKAVFQEKEQAKNAHYCQFLSNIVLEVLATKDETRKKYISNQNWKRNKSVTVCR